MVAEKKNGGARIYDDVNNFETKPRWYGDSGGEENREQEEPANLQQFIYNYIVW